MEPNFIPAQILLPNGETNMTKWSALACDQFTSQPEYWLEAEKLVGEAPSTLKLVLPEVYLEKPDKSVRIGKIHAAMKAALDNVLTTTVNGFVYTRRTTQSGVREGLIGMVDLEAYSYEKGAKPAIRPTEKTVVERIPPRIAVRRGAALEAPHILMLIDDAAKHIIEPLNDIRAELEELYNFELMAGGGHIEGYAVTSEEHVKRICDELSTLGTQAHFDSAYPKARGEKPLALAVGDGNHSLATAKAYWEELKSTLSRKELETHPARYCLAELVNVHCDAILIEPIHRVIFKATQEDFIVFAEKLLIEKGAQLLKKPTEDCQSFILCGNKKDKAIYFNNSPKALSVGTLDMIIEAFLSENKFARVDFVHDEDSVRALCKNGAVGILLPAFDKGDIFKGVILGGVLPKKTFSMGTAREKRYYLECRKIK